MRLETGTAALVLRHPLSQPLPKLLLPLEEEDLYNIRRFLLEEAHLGWSIPDLRCFTWRTRRGFQILNWELSSCKISRTKSYE